MTRIANGHHHGITRKGDTVLFSSREIPGNEVAIQKVQDNLIARGLRSLPQMMPQFMYLAILPEMT